MQDFGNLILMGPDLGDVDRGFETAFKRVLQLKGIPIDPLTENIIQNIISEYRFDFEENLRSQGFPSKLLELFSLKKKKDAEKFAKNFYLLKIDFVRAIFNAQICGFTHHKIFNYFLPEDVRTTPEEREALGKNGIGQIRDKKAKKIVKKIQEHFKKRRVVTAHIFMKGTEWHLLYFDYNDAYVEKGTNHFKDGPHLHYSSHLMARESVQVGKTERGRQLLHCYYKDAA